jgi:hypothetical protein
MAADFVASPQFGFWGGRPGFGFGGFPIWGGNTIANANSDAFSVFGPSNANAVAVSDTAHLAAALRC